MSVFIKAVREKFRFNTSKGLVSSEDLWDLPLTSNTKPNLDSIAIELKKDLDGLESTSFVRKNADSKKTRIAAELEVVVYVINTKLEEQKAKEDAILRRQQKEQIASLIEAKKGEALQSKSIEELEAMAKDL